MGSEICISVQNVILNNQSVINPNAVGLPLPPASYPPTAAVLGNLPSAGGQFSAVGNLPVNALPASVAVNLPSSPGKFAPSAAATMGNFLPSGNLPPPSPLPPALGGNRQQILAVNNVSVHLKDNNQGMTLFICKPCFYFLKLFLKKILLFKYLESI